MVELYNSPVDQSASPPSTDLSTYLSLHRHIQLQQEAGSDPDCSRDFILKRFLPAAKAMAAELETSNVITNRGHHALPSLHSTLASELDKEQSYPPFPIRNLKQTMNTNSTTNRCDPISSCGFFCAGIKMKLASKMTPWSSSSQSSSKDSTSPKLTSILKTQKKPASQALVHPFTDEELIKVMSKLKATIKATREQTEVLPHAKSSGLCHKNSVNRMNGKHCPLLNGVDCDEVSLSTSPGSTPPLRTTSSLSRPIRLWHDSCANNGNKFPQGSHVSTGFNSKKTQLLDQFNQMETRSIPAQSVSTSSPIFQGTFMRDDNGMNKFRQHECESEDDEAQFYDAPSRWHSATLDDLVLDGSLDALIEDTNGYSDCADNSFPAEDFVQFETPRTSVTDHNPLLSGENHGREPCQPEQLESMRTSSLQKRVGKVLKLKTELDEGDAKIHEISPSSARCRLNINSESLRECSCSPSPKKISDTCFSASARICPPVFPAKCQNSHLGWPFGISSYSSETSESTPQSVYLNNTELGSNNGLNKSQSALDRSTSSICTDNTPQTLMKNQVGMALGFNMPSPPLPPSPSKSWLEKAITKNATMPSPLASLQQKERTTSTKKKVDVLLIETPIEAKMDDPCESSSQGKNVDYIPTINTKKHGISKPPKSPKPSSSSSSPFASLQQKFKTSSMRKKLDFNAIPLKHEVNTVGDDNSNVSKEQEDVNSSARKKLDYLPDEDVSEGKWEDVVKGSHMNPRFSEAYIDFLLKS